MCQYVTPDWVDDDEDDEPEEQYEPDHWSEDDWDDWDEDYEDTEEYEPEPPEDQFRDDVEADADTLRSAGYGTDEDYCPDTPMGDYYGGE